MTAGRGTWLGMLAGLWLASACSSGGGGMTGAAGTGGSGNAAGSGGTAGGPGTAGGTGTAGASGSAGGGAGLFSGGATYPFGAAIAAIDVADLNGDGRPDIVAVSGCTTAGDPGDLLVMLNQGAGTFAPPTRTTAAGPAPVALAVGDLNGDGKPDAAIANRSGVCSNAPAFESDVTVLLNGGGGTFGAPTHLPGGAVPWHLTVADLNGDGRNDIAVANHGTGTELELRESGVTVLLATAGGGFAAPTKVAAGVGPVAVRAADLDGGGRADLIVANYGYSGIGAPDGTSTISVLLSNAGGGFAPMKSLPALPGCSDVSFVDFDGDQDLDLVVNNYSGLHTIRNDGGGVFTSATSNFAPLLAAGSAAIGDYDGDGRADFAVGAYGGAFLIGGNGDGTFRAPARLPVPESPAGVLTADFDGDGKPDLAVINEAGLTVLRNAR